VDADALYDYAGLMVCEVCGFPQVGFEDDPHCGAVGGVPPTARCEDAGAELDLHVPAGRSEADDDAMRLFAPMHIAKYLESAPHFEALLDASVQTTVDPSYNKDSVSRVSFLQCCFVVTLS
jgi:hypothetical protein